MRYFAFRISAPYAEDLEAELKIGHLRQGWGYDSKLNLRERNTARKDKGARKNYPIKDRVKKDDFIFIISMPDKKHVTLAVATQDFDKGYVYDELSFEREHDFGHIFPAKYLATIPKEDLASIKNSFFCPRRFFEIKRHQDKLNELIVKYYTF